MFLFIPSFLHSFILSFFHSFIPSSLHSFIPSFFHSFIPSSLHSFTLPIPLPPRLRKPFPCRFTCRSIFPYTRTFLYELFTFVRSEIIPVFPQFPFQAFDWDDQFYCHFSVCLLLMSFACRSHYGRLCPVFLPPSQLFA